jgi:hypothetical protein
MITEGHLVRHYQGRSGGRDPALIDRAQDHLLYRLSESGVFDMGIALKGGLRDMDEFECRAAKCSRGEEWQVRQAIVDLGAAGAERDD